MLNRIWDMLDHKKPRIIGLTIGVLVIHTLAYGQSNTWSPERREIEIEYADSTVQAYISIQNLDLETSDALYYFWYDNEQIHKNQGGYDGLLLDGVYTVYNKQNRLIVKGTFSKGLMDGSWRRWDGSGNLIHSSSYRQGQLHGESIRYNPDGSSTKEVYKKGNVSESLLVGWNKKLHRQQDTLRIDSL